MLQCKIQRLRFTGIWLGEHRQLTGRKLGGKRLARRLEGVVRRSIVDYDDPDVPVIGVEHRANRADNHRLLVVRRNDHRNSRFIHTGRNTAVPDASNQRQYSHQDQPRAHQHVAYEEHIHNKVAEEGQEEKCNRVNARLPAHLRRDGRHHLGGGFAHQLGDRHQLVSLGAKCRNQQRQRGDRRRAVAASVVHENDAAAKPRLVLHDRELGEYVVRDLLRRLARVLIPIVGIDLVADDGVAHLLNAISGGGLVVRVRLLIDRVGRTKIKRLDAELGGKEPLGEIQLQLDLAVGYFADIRMRKRVIADLMAFAYVTLQETGIVLPLLTNHQERGLHVVLLQHVENLWRPGGIGAVVKAQRKLIRVVPVLLDHIGPRQRLHAL